MASNTSKLSQELIKYTQEIKRLQEQLSKVKKGTIDYDITQSKLNATIKKGKEAKEQYISSLSKLNRGVFIQNTAIEKSDKVVGDFNNTIAKTGGGLSNLAGSFLKTIVTVGKFFLAYQALNLVISAFKEAVIGSISTFVKFEDTLGRIQAVTSSTAEDMNNISNAIKTTAVETRFTATEIANLGVSLGKLGATSKEIPDLLRPIASAAQATGEDIASVGEAVLKTNNQFGISSKDTVVTAAVFAEAINGSALSLSSLTTALQYVGPLASQAGLTFADTSGYMKVLADNGFAASKIGTGLRSVFINLKESGKPLIETLKELSAQNISLAKAIELTDVRAAGQLLTLLENIDVIEKSIDITYALTKARQAEAAQMKTTAAQADVLKAVYENLQLSFGRTIADNELLLEGIGRLDKQSEIMLRTQIALNKIFSNPRGTDAYQAALKNVTEKGAVPLTEAFKLIETAGISSGTELSNIFASAAEKLNISEGEAMKLLYTIARGSKDGSNAAYKLQKAFADQGNAATFAKQELELWANTFDDIKKYISVVDGVTDAIEKDSRAVKDNAIQSEIRQQVVEKYSKTVEDINRNERAGISQQSRRIALDTRIRKDIEEQTKAVNKLKRQEDELLGVINQEEQVLGVLVSSKRGSLVPLRENIELEELKLKFIKDQLTGVLEINAAYEAALKERIDSQNKSIDLTIRDREIELDAIRDKDKASEKRMNKRIAYAQELYDLEVKAALTNEQLDNARQKRDEEIYAAKEQRFLDLFGLEEESAELARNAQVDQKAYIDEAKRLGFDEGQIERINKVFLSFDDKVKDSRKFYIALKEALLEVGPYEQAQSQIDQAGESIGLFTERVNALQKASGRNFKNNKQYQESLAALKKEEKAYLEGIIDQIDSTTDGGKAAIGVIQKLIENVEASGTAATESGNIYAEVFKGVFLDAARTALNAADEFNKVAFENTINRLEAEKDAIKERASFEEDILKSQLDSQLISQEEYQSRLQQIKKKEIQRQNAVERKIFEEENKRDKDKAKSNFLLALASIIPNLITNEGKASPTNILIIQAITGALAAAAYGSQVRAIDNRRFFDKKFAKGGIVEGPSHEQGGVPFSVKGVGGYEMEGGEYIVNKKSAAKYRTLLDQINETKYTPKYKFATGGIVGSLEKSDFKQIELLEAIAEATTGTAINTGRPVRAFVSSSDLQNDTNARRIKDRNSNI